MEHTTSALCAQAIRKELKQLFPKIKFSVTSDNFAGGDSVNIRYTDGVGIEEVRKVCGKYQYGHFDSSIDLYEYSNERKDLPAQAKYVSVSREFSEETQKKLMLELCKKYGLQQKEDLNSSFEFFGNLFSFSQLIWKEYSNQEVIS